MSLMKAKVEAHDVLKFLRDDFDRNILSVNFVSGGELSQAFSFISNDQNFIIRVNLSKSSFIKDKYAYENFSSSTIPIPKVIKIGELNTGLYFCITEKVEGSGLDALEEKDREILYPQLVEILDAIHTVKISSGKYGWWEGDGIAEFDTWKDYIFAHGNKTRVSWETFYGKTILEKDFIEKIYTEMEKLADSLPEERFLIHGDYGGDNVLYDGDKITGIIDWGNSSYGDFLYDVAYQEFWGGQAKIARVYYDYYKNTKWNIENYDQRIKCYLLHIGIGVLEFWARADLGEKYEISKKRISEYLEI